MQTLKVEPIFLAQEFEDYSKGTDIVHTGVVIHGSGKDPYLESRDEMIHQCINIGGTPQHLYLISIDKTNVLDYFYVNEDISNRNCEHPDDFHDGGKILRCEGIIGISCLANDGNTYFETDCYKVVASTNKTLGIPKINTQIVQYLLETCDKDGMFPDDFYLDIEAQRQDQNSWYRAGGGPVCADLIPLCNDKDEIIMNFDEKSYLFGICEWLKTTEEYKSLPVTNPNSIFYNTSLLTFAKLILKFKNHESKNKEQ